ncbi:MAG: 16S rRNA (cytosine(967)-C(5))-methyltransferase RsmB [Vulcanimicrobiaceae bacterium]
MKTAGPVARSSAREVALTVVRDVFGPEHRGAQAAFDVRTRRAGLDLRDRAFAAELAYGSIKQRRLLDWYLAPYLAGRARPLPPTIVEVLRLGIYQLRFMGGVDVHAAVFETVKLALCHGHRGTGGLVNAVLRRFIADAPAAPQADDFPSEDDFAGTAYSVPTWIAAQWHEALNGARDAALAGINAAPQHAVRVNTLRASLDEVRAALAQAGTSVRPSPFVREIWLAEGSSVADDPGGRWTVQGESAAMPVDLLAPQPGESVLELCSGRGNKSVQLAARLGASGSLVCVELETRRARRLEEALARAGASGVAVVQGDARSAAPELRADAVLLDAPCSGLGVLGRHPEARWRKSPDDGARLAEVQAALLAAAAERTRPGGRLVYSVCSTDPREGRDRVEAFLAGAPEFARAELPPRYAPFASAGDVVVPPGIEGRDGFYIAVLGKR